MSETNFNLSTLDGNNGFIIEGINDDNLGYSVSNAGDLNGDQIGDIAIGSPLSDPNSKSNSGKTYIIFGRKEGFSQTFDLSTLNGTNGFVINGAGEGDESGRSVTNLGDINGDGVDDLGIGAPFADTNGSDSGAAYVIFGSKDPNYFTNPIELSNLDPANGFTIRGSQSGDTAGWAISAAGDINGDGIKDLVIGATNSGGNSGPGIKGESYVIFGKNTGFASGSSLDLSNLSPNDGLKIISNELSNLGYSVSDAGDVNGDGVDDLIIGAPYADPNDNYNAGQTFVIYGRNTANPFTTNVINVSELTGSDGFAINGQNNERSGFFVSKAGDINGDGIGDLIIGAPNGFSNGQDSTGKTYVVFGNNNGFGPSLNLSDLNGSNGFTINGIAPFGNSGFSVSDAGDINNDGIGDIIIGAPNANNSGGQGYVIYGSRAGFSPTLDLSSLNGDNGFFINGLAEGDLTGLSVSGAGDINGDGTKDLLIAAPFANSQAGAAYVIFGTFVNQAPTGLELSNNSISENVPANTQIGSLSTIDPNAIDTFTYSLVAGDGDSDNGLFTITDNQLQTNAVFDYEAKNSYSILVQTTDKGGLSFQKQFTIGVTDVAENEGPSDLSLDISTVAENESSGTAIGTFSTQDPDTENTFIYSLVAGDGDIDNSLFTITDNQLQTNAVFDYEAKNSYSILVQTTDQGGLSSQKQFTIGVTDVNEAPTDLLLEGGTVAENQALGTAVGTFSTQDPDTGNTFTYSLVAGDGDVDNSVFTITDNQLQTNAVFDYEAKNSYSILVQTTDQGGLSSQKQFTIGVTDIAENQILDFTNTSGVPLNINPQNNPEGESLDLRNVTGTVNIEFLVSREASYNNFVGFYRITDENGGIDTNGDGNADILPGQDGYIQAAINARITDINLSANNGETAISTAALQGGSIFAPFLIANGTLDALLDSDPNNNPDVYFTFLGANSDGFDHIRSLDNNTFAFEDLRNGGDQDFNDLIIQVNFI